MLKTIPKIATIKTVAPPYFEAKSILIYKDDILKISAIPNKSVDLIVTSPPLSDFFIFCGGVICWERFSWWQAGIVMPAPRFPMKQNWFETKAYGIGWKPITWQGWAVSLTYLAFIITAFVWVDRASHSASDTLIGFAPFFIFSTSLSVFISRVKSEKCKLLAHAQTS